MYVCVLGTVDSIGIGTHPQQGVHDVVVPLLGRQHEARAPHAVWGGVGL